MPKKEKTPIISLDLETTGLNPRKDKILGIAQYKDGQASYIPWDLLHYDSNAHWIDKAEYIFHNGKFDLQFLQRHNIPPPNEVHDTMIMSYLLDPKREGGHNLKNLCETILHVPHDDMQAVLRDYGVQTTSELPFEVLANKSKADVTHTYQLFHVLKAQMSPALWQLYTKLEIPCMLALMDIEMQGINIDVKYLQSLKQSIFMELEESLSLLCHRVKQLGYTGIMTSDVRKKDHPKHLNLNSPKQITELLYKTLNLAKQVRWVVFKKAGLKKVLSTDIHALVELQEAHPIVPLLIQYRNANKRMSTYIKPLEKEIKHNEENKVYPRFNQCVTATGRLSSSNPINFQNIPKRSNAGNAIRGCFVATPGHLLLEADFAQIEPRIMAHSANDITLRKIFTSGNELYCDVVKSILSCSDEEAKKKRPLGKLLFLAMGYGAQPKKLIKAAKQDDIILTEDEASAFITQAELTYKDLFAYKRKVIHQAQQQGYVETLCGRRRYFTGLTSADKWIRLKQEREAFNTVIQGSAADIMKLAIVALHKQNINILLTVHDSVLVEVEDKGNNHDYHIGQIMEGVVHLQVPLIVEVKKLENWGGIQKEVVHAQ